MSTQTRPAAPLCRIPHPGSPSAPPAAVSDGRTVYVAQLTAPPQPVPVDIRTQTRQVLGLLETVLRRAHSSPALLLRAELTVADSRCIPAVQAVWDAWCPAGGPAPVWRFGRLPGALVAVDAVAAVVADAPCGD